jgi:hypothetical protein
MTAAAKYLTELPLDPRPHHGIADFAGDSQSEPSDGANCWKHEPHQGSYGQFLAPLLHTKKVGTLSDARRTGKPLRGTDTGHDRTAGTTSSARRQRAASAPSRAGA